MCYFKKFEKPSVENGSEYFANYSEYYNKLKECADTVVVNEGKDDEFIFANVNDMGEFVITSVSRDDFESVGFDASSLTNKEMLSVADNMSDIYVGDGGFWEYLEYYGEDNNLPRINNNNESKEESENED